MTEKTCDEPADGGQIGRSESIPAGSRPQIEFDFERASHSDGYEAWLEQRGKMLEELGEKIGLPLGRQVEVWLRDGVRLRGKLLTRQTLCFIDNPRDPRLELQVDRATFKLGEMESCVRLD